MNLNLEEAVDDVVGGYSPMNADELDITDVRSNDDFQTLIAKMIETYLDQVLDHSKVKAKDKARLNVKQHIQAVKEAASQSEDKIFRLSCLYCEKTANPTILGWRRFVEKNCHKTIQQLNKEFFHHFDWRFQG